MADGKVARKSIHVTENTIRYLRNNSSFLSYQSRIILTRVTVVVFGTLQDK